MIKVVGLDPAFRKGGFGYCELRCDRNKVVDVSFGSFADFKAFFVFVNSTDSKVVWGVENSNLQNITFAKYVKSHKISRNVGANQAVSQVTVDILRWHFGENNVIEFSPKQKGAKWSLDIANGVLHSYGLPRAKKISQDKIDALKIAILTLEKAKLNNLL